MIGCVTFGTNKYDEAARFYDGLFATTGAGCVMEGVTSIAWGTAPRAPAVCMHEQGS